MKSKLNYFFILISIFLLSACSAFQMDEKTGIPIDPRIRAEQEAELAKADENFENGYMSLAKEGYSEFSKKFPNSIFYQRSRFGLAQTLEAESKWAEAASIYRDTIGATRERQPEIAAQALYRVSVCYENLQDETRVLASLKDAMNLKKYLRPEQIEAEIPARMAASYSRMGLLEDAKKQLQKADEGIQEVIKNQRSNMNQQELNQWSSEIYYKMGLFSTSQLNSENIQASLDSFKMVQIFSLRSVELGVQPWSEYAQQKMLGNYKDFWKAARTMPLAQGLDQEAAQRQRTERQIHFAGEILALMTDLKSSRAILPEMRGPLSDSLFKSLTVQEEELQKFLYDQGETTKLTPDALKRNQMRKTKMKLQDPQR